MIWPFTTIAALRAANRALTAHHIAARAALNSADAARHLILGAYTRVAEDLDALTPPSIRIGDPAQADTLSTPGDD